MRIDSLCQSEGARQGPVFVRSPRVHLYRVGTHSLPLSQPLTTAICNAVMWSTVSLCPSHTHTRSHIENTHTCSCVHRRSQDNQCEDSSPHGAVETCVSDEHGRLRVLFHRTVKQFTHVLKYNCGDCKSFKTQTQTLLQSWFLMFLIC